MHKNQPDILIAIGIIIFLFFLDILIGISFYDAGILFDYGDPQASIISVISTGIVISTVMHFTGLTYQSLFHYSENSVFSTALILFPPVIIVILGSMWWLIDLVTYIDIFVPEVKRTLEALERTMSDGYITLIAVCLIAPFLEEMLFRGIILRGFLSHYSPRKSIIVSALIFGVVHLNLYQLPVAFILGCFLGWIYYLSRSLWPAILAHALYNGGVYVQYIYNAEGYNSIFTNILTFAISLGGILMLARIYNVKFDFYNR